MHNLKQALQPESVERVKEEEIKSEISESYSNTDEQEGPIIPKCYEFKTVESNEANFKRKFGD